MQPALREAMPYRRLYQSLRDQIANGELVGQLPSIAELAVRYGVNRNTVKKALGQLKEHRFVYGVQGKGVFVNPDGGVNALAQRNVALYLHHREMLNPVYSRLVYELRVQLERERCAVTIINTLTQLKAFAGQIDALILFEQFRDDELAYMETFIPRERILLCNCRAPRGWACSEVATDNREGGRMAMRHLYECGCRDVGVLGIHYPSDEDIFTLRRKGVFDFRAAHPDLAVDIIDIPMPFVLGRLGSEWARRLFRDGRRPDGVFVFMDIMAFSVYHICAELDAKPLVLGFDDQSFAEQFFPPLSSIREDTDAIASEVARLVRAVLTGDDRIERIPIPPILTPRESTCPL